LHFYSPSRKRIRDVERILEDDDEFGASLVLGFVRVFTVHAKESEIILDCLIEARSLDVSRENIGIIGVCKDRSPDGIFGIHSSIDDKLIAEFLGTRAIRFFIYFSITIDTEYRPFGKEA